MESTVAVITGSVGCPFLRDAVASVRAQTYAHVRHYVVVDGPEHHSAVVDLLSKEDTTNVTVLTLPHNTGKSGYVCHRINAALPWLLDTPYVCFLDEDNTFEPHHIEGLVRAVRGKKWAHSLRTIIAQDGTPIAPDACESLGGIRHSFLDPGDYHVDTNCYLLDTHLARQLAPCWDVKARPGGGRLEADRAVCRTLLGSRLLPGVSRTHSVRYRVASRPDSVCAEFFTQGNERTGFDAEKPDVYLMHFTAEATRTAVTPAARSAATPLDEWAPTLWQGLQKSYNLLDGFANAHIIPPGALVLVTVWHPDALKLDVLKRTDIFRVLCMVESPNIRHTAQFTRTFLDAHADLVLTYWTPLLRDMGPERAAWCPMNTHALDLDNPAHRALGLRDNRGRGRSVAIVLERRPGLAGEYAIDGTSLQCLDPLREVYVRGLRDVVCYGAGWEGVPGVTVGHTLGKLRDPKHAVDILQDYTFALIIENCDAHGYVSEKLYDALMAGCVPLYFGSPAAQHALPPEAFVDIRAFDNGHALQEYLDSLQDEDVQRMREVVRDTREGILRGVGVQAFADIFGSSAASLYTRNQAARG